MCKLGLSGLEECGGRQGEGISTRSSWVITSFLLLAITATRI